MGKLCYDVERDWICTGALEFDLRIGPFDAAVAFSVNPRSLCDEPLLLLVHRVQNGRCIPGHGGRKGLSCIRPRLRDNETSDPEYCIMLVSEVHRKRRLQELERRRSG